MNVDPDAAAAVSCTGGAAWKGAIWGVVQAGPQLIPAGTEDTVPVPLPLFVTVRTDARPKVAVQSSGNDVIAEELIMGKVIVFPLMVPRVTHTPLQLLKLEPGSSAAVSVTLVLLPL